MSGASQVRVLLAGGPPVDRREPISAKLQRLRAEHGDRLVVVHGDCRTGADRIARELCKALAIRQERHPAEWDRHGRSAGPIQNRAMVASGASLCVAFVDGDSAGTRELVAMAELAGTEIRLTDAARVRRGDRSRPPRAGRGRFPPMFAAWNLT